MPSLLAPTLQSPCPNLAVELLVIVLRVAAETTTQRLRGEAMRARSARNGAIALLVLGCVLAGTAVDQAVRSTDGFRIDRAVACRGYVDGEPVDPGHEFLASEGIVFVWFEGDEATRSVTVHAECRRGSVLIGKYQLTLPRGSTGGTFSIALKSGDALPTGEYTMALTVSGRRAAVVRFRVIRDPMPESHASTRSILCERPADGFALMAGEAWVAVQREAVPLLLMRVAPFAAVLVVPRTHETPVVATALRDALCETLGSDPTARIVGRGTCTVDGRDAATVVVDMSDGTRQKIVLIPRDDVRYSNAFLNVMLSAPRAGFAQTERELDAMLTTFRVLPRSVP
jgi:hypothetical protein